MDNISATDAKQSFGLLLEEVLKGPVAITKHGRPVALVISPQHALSDAKAALVAARSRQREVDADRLIRHQRIALEMLLSDVAYSQLVLEAKQRVSNWKVKGVCSDDYIDRWSALLKLPARELAIALSSDLDGWGKALRQNSPWIAA